MGGLFTKDPQTGEYKAFTFAEIDEAPILPDSTTREIRSLTTEISGTMGWVATDKEVAEAFNVIFSCCGEAPYRTKICVKCPLLSDCIKKKIANNFNRRTGYGI